MRIALVADSHLAARAPECVHNWHAVREAVARGAVDLTIHLGDISLDGENHPEELAYAAHCLAAWPTPLHCVPGNHDMGTASGEEPLSPASLRRSRDAFGPDRWHLQSDGWSLLGLNAQLLASGSEAEAQQWRWLEAQVAALDAQAQVALFLHRPLVQPPGQVGLPDGCCAHASAAEPLLRLPGLAGKLRLVASGHAHRGLEFLHDGVRHLWLPSTAFVIDDGWLDAGIGRDEVGLGLLTLEPDALGYERLQPPGVVRHRMTQLPCCAGG